MSTASAAPAAGAQEKSHQLSLLPLIALVVGSMIGGETYERGGAGRNRDIVVGGLATIYGVWLCYAAGPKYLLLTTILFAPATVIYMLARRERGERMFTAGELAIAALVTAAALYAIYELLTGGISV
ncbi:MAG TPA: hypothetical protein VMU06_13640 [Stellaceae bacterium]|nr:hypothetical protein [Stellaceae bacterium]